MSAPSAPSTGRRLEAAIDAIVEPHQPCHHRLPATVMLGGDLLVGAAKARPRKEM